MASMNKPAYDTADWYQSITDNWNAIQNSLIDKSLLTAKGDLYATTGPSALARLRVGNNDQVLNANSQVAAGVKWKNLDDVALDQGVKDILWGKKFFSDEGFLPSTKQFEYLDKPPAFAGTVGTPTWTIEDGAVRPSAASGLAYYDLGSAKSKILIVIGNMVKFSSNIAVILSSSAPGSINPDGFSMFNDTAGLDIYKCVSGTYTRLDTSTGLANVDYLSGYALYYDDSTDTLKMFVRMAGQWFLAQSATSTQFTTMRYISFRSYAANQRWVTPYVCYAQ